MHGITVLHATEHNKKRKQKPIKWQNPFCQYLLEWVGTGLCTLENQIHKINSPWSTIYHFSFTDTLSGSCWFCAWFYTIAKFVSYPVRWQNDDWRKIKFWNFHRDFQLLRLLCGLNRCMLYLCNVRLLYRRSCWIVFGAPSEACELFVNEETLLG